MRQNKDKQIEKMNYWIYFLASTLFLVSLVLILLYYGDGERSYINLEKQLQSCQDKVLVKECYIVNEVTTRYWIPEENLIVGQNTYIENITKVNCEVIE